MRIIDIINLSTPRFTFELLPPLRGEGPESVFEAIETLRPLDPAYINVTFHREQRPGTIAISAEIKRRYGIETVPHLICGGLGRDDISYSLADMALSGLDNVLALRGDSTEKGHHKYASELVEQIHAECPEFCIGVAGYPEGHAESPDLETGIAHLKRKIDAGAHYVVTQMCFDNARIFEFIERAKKAGINVPIVPGIKPLATLKHLEILPQLFRVALPDELVNEVKKCADNASVRQVGIEWAAAQAEELKRAGLPVIHFYSMGRTDNIARIVEKVF